MRGGSALAVAAGAGIVAALALRPHAHGVPPATALVFWASLLGLAVVPGTLLVHGARLCPDERFLLLGQGTTVGLALHGLAFLAGRSLGAPWLALAVALAAAGIGLALARRRPPTQKAPPLPPREVALTLVVLLLAVLVPPLTSFAALGDPVPSDLLFHAGNAAELRHRWPLEDPRAAGVPLRYHMLAYALPIEAADRASAPLVDPLLGLAPLLWVALLGLQAANAGRVLFGDARAGAIGAALVVLHSDPGAALGLGPGAFNSHLATGVHGSPTTVLGLVLLAALAIALEAWLTRREWRSLGTLALLAAAASAAKTTVVPVVLGALALAGGARVLVSRRTSELGRWAAALAAVSLASAPLTLWQGRAEAGYSGMVHWRPGVAFSSSPFAAAVSSRLGPDAVGGVLGVSSFLAWLLGFLGLAGVGTAVWLARRREPLSPAQAWALGVALVGAALGLLLDVPGLSQLFLLYNGQLLLALFAGAALSAALRPPRSALDLGVAVLLALAALPAVAGVLRVLPAAARADAAAAGRKSTPLQADYAAGLEWLRAHAAADAVVFADNPSLLLSGLGEVRLFYENGVYTARAWQAEPGAEPWPERAALQERLLRRPDAEAMSEARRAVGPGPRLLIVADHVPSRIEAGFVLASPAAVPPRRFFPEALFERVYASGAMQVYEARER